MIRPILACALVLTMLTAGPAAAQQQDDEEARVHFRLGRAYYDSGRFVEAAREFEQAYALSRRPQLLYNVFIAHRDAGQLGRAIEALEQYLAQVPDAQDRDNLTARLASMRRLHERELAAQESSTGAGGTATTTEPREDGDPPPAEDATPPDPEADEGGDGAPDDTARGAPEPTRGGSGSIVPWIVLGTGGALVIGGAVTGVMALSAEGELEDMCPMDACDPGFEDTRDRGQTLATVADVLLLTGAVAAAAGAALVFLLDDDGSVERDPAVSAACAGDGCAASVRLRF